MSKPDTRFLNVFSIVSSVVVAIAMGVLLAACKPSGDAADAGNAEAVAERIKPVGEVAVEGQTPAEPAAAPAEEAPAPAAAVVSEPAAAVVATAAPAAVDGAAIYQSACSVCHGMGIAGAPKVGDKAVWAPRIAQGEATLHKHSIEGYKGSAGIMPAKGGRADLSDAAVMAAVDHMVAASR